ncbi:MAG: ATP-dependent RecD-like DNA helicase [Alphaproteobacteria bacterium]
MAEPHPQSDTAAPFKLEQVDAPGRTLAGVVEHVVYRSEDSGYHVLRVKAEGEREAATVVGHAASIAPGERIRAEGSWTTHRSYGKQFSADTLTVIPPSSLDEIEAYLASGMIKGVGKTMAKKLVNRFGEQVFEVIEHRPERLTDVPGLGKALAKRITEAWEEQRAVKDIMLFLQSRGFSRLRADRIFEAYGNKAIETVSKNPYQLARDIRGIGFMAADELAAKLEIARDSPFRLAAGLRHVLEEAMGQGHVGLPRSWLTERAADLLQAEGLDPVLDGEVDDGRLIVDKVGDTDCLFLPEMHAAEEDIAAALIERAWQPPPWHIRNIEDTVKSVEATLALELAEEQREALRLAYKSRLLIITGGPGTGKTTLVRAILQGLERNQLDIMLAAPTGRAARRLGESSGREASTLHRLLEAEPGRGFRRDAERPLEGDLLIVDEMSMVDIPLMQALSNALPEQAALFLVGDVDQLPSIGPGQVLLDLISSGKLPVIRLEKIFRQAEESRIIRNAHRINKGEMPDLSRSDADLVDFYAIRATTPERAAETLVELVAERIPKTFGVDPVQDIQVLCPTNRGPIGTRALNEKLQTALNANAVDRIDHRGIAYATGDKVMQIENDYEREVYNGDIGRITAIDRAAKVMTVTIDGNPQTYGFDELDNLVPAYAITVHKAQGSEYPAVVLPLARQQGRMLRRNLVYTAITRARRLVVLLVEPGALELAIEQRPEVRRWSRLRDLLSA